MVKDSGCNVCRVCCVAVILVALIGGGGIGVYFAIDKKGVANLDETTNSVAESKASATSDATNFGDRNKAVTTKTRFYGLNYSPFGLGDNRLCSNKKKEGGLCLLADQVKADMRQIASMTKRIKTYSLNCLPQTKLIVEYARDQGMTVMLGVWVDKDPKLNDIEIIRLVELLSELKDAGGAITDLCVGNEAVFVGKVARKELIRVIKKARDAVRGAGVDIKIGTAEVFAYWSGLKNDDFAGAPPMTDVAKVVDFIGLNTHGYYSGVDPLKVDAGVHVKGERDALQKFFRDKGFKQPVIVAETGFPTGGKPWKTSSGTATPSVAATRAFATQMEDVSRANKMAVYYFEPFDGVRFRGPCFLALSFRAWDDSF